MKPRNYNTGTPKLRYTQIVHCTLWEESKQTQCPTPEVGYNTCDFWLSGLNGKYNRNIFLFNPLSPFPSKMMRCPWILCFDLLPLQYTDLTHEIWRFQVCVFLEKTICVVTTANALQYYFTVVFLFHIFLVLTVAKYFKTSIKINLIASSCFRSRILRTKELLTSGLSRELLTSGLSRTEPYNLETVFYPY